MAGLTRSCTLDNRDGNQSITLVIFRGKGKLTRLVAARSLQENALRSHIRPLNITLSAEQKRWLETRISDGKFQSPEDAFRQLTAERMILDDDIGWAKPSLDEARQGIARGDVSSLEEAESDIDRTLKLFEV